MVLQGRQKRTLEQVEGRVWAWEWQQKGPVREDRKGSDCSFLVWHRDPQSNELNFSFLLLSSFPCPPKQKCPCVIGMVRGPGPSPEAEETPPFPQALAAGAQNPIRTPALEPVLKDLTLWDENQTRCCSLSHLSILLLAGGMAQGQQAVSKLNMGSPFQEQQKPSRRPTRPCLCGYLSEADGSWGRRTHCGAPHSSPSKTMSPWGKGAWWKATSLKMRAFQPVCARWAAGPCCGSCHLAYNGRGLR